jgi:hypothetical protein
LKKDCSAATSVFKNLRGQAWKDALVDFNPIQEFINDLEVG